MEAQKFFEGKDSVDTTKIRTLQEEYINSRHLETSVLLNCENCKRCFYADFKLANKKVDAKIPMLCNRCKNKINSFIKKSFLKLLIKLLFKSCIFA